MLVGQPFLENSRATRAWLAANTEKGRGKTRCFFTSISIVVLGWYPLTITCWWSRMIYSGSETCVWPRQPTQWSPTGSVLITTLLSFGGHKSDSAPGETDAPNRLFMKDVGLSFFSFFTHQIYSVQGLPDLNIAPQSLSTWFFFSLSTFWPKQPSKNNEK